MDFAAPHLGFVAASYAITAIVLAVLCIRILMRDRALRREAERLDRERPQR
jgi:heme exporter protein CcmD